MTDKKLYSDDRWKYHKGDYKVVKQLDVKLTHEQRVNSEEFLKSVEKSMKNKHRQ